MEFTKKQLDLLKKYNLKQEDIKEIKTTLNNMALALERIAANYENMKSNFDRNK
jgi:uncharacterized protein YsxB (DUF464 family)